jgi:hypothetical protein
MKTIAARAGRSKKPIFTSEYWERPTPRSKGAQDADAIYRAVGWALSNWEKADQELAGLFSVLTNCTDEPISATTIRRAYGAIESNSGRRKAVEAVAEVFFGNYWDEPLIRQSVTDIITAVQRASRLRDDIAHGIVWEDIVIGEQDYGAFHMPPQYNTGRTHAFRQDDGDLGLLRAKYRYTDEDILTFGKKFVELRDTLRTYLISIIPKQDGTVPLIEELVAAGKIKRRKWYGARPSLYPPF